MEILFAPARFFVWHPERITLVAGLFFFASLWRFSSKGSAWPMFYAGIGWALFAMWELHCKNHGYNIRVDMFMIVPVLFVLTGWGLQYLFRRQVATSTADGES
jgi:hypothetical protein